MSTVGNTFSLLLKGEMHFNNHSPWFEAKTTLKELRQKYSSYSYLHCLAEDCEKAINPETQKTVYLYHMKNDSYFKRYREDQLVFRRFVDTYKHLNRFVPHCPYIHYVRDFALHQTSSPRDHDGLMMHYDDMFLLCDAPRPTLRLNELISDKHYNPSYFLTYAFQMASALSHLHSINIMHGEFVPCNIFVTDNHKQIVVDIPVIKPDEPFITLRHVDAQFPRNLQYGLQAYLVTPEYKGYKFTPASDVWAMGVTLYEILTQNSFGRDHISDVQALFDNMRELRKDYVMVDLISRMLAPKNERISAGQAAKLIANEMKLREMAVSLRLELQRGVLADIDCNTLI
jgi:serine/threonine protein kinase